VKEQCLSKGPSLTLLDSLLQEVCITDWNERDESLKRIQLVRVNQAGISVFPNLSWKDSGRLPFTIEFEFIFHLQTHLRLSFICKKKWGRLPFIKQLRLSSIEQTLRSSFIYNTNWGRLPFRTNSGRLLLTKMKLSSICQDVEVVFH
jgi:hypothetical protein